MICVYESTATDFSNNGLGAVTPLSCSVTETLNGEWELTLVHPIDENGKWLRMTEGRILRAPVPAAMTPRIDISVPASSETWIYRVSVSYDYLYLRSGPGTGYAVLSKYPRDTQVIVIDRGSYWYEVTCPDGKHGYMASAYLTYVRTASTPQEAKSEVIEARQLRDQPFRIYRVVPDLDRVTVYARHIFYDLLDNMIRSYRPSSSATGAVVLQGISGNCLSPHGFTFYSDLTSTAEETEFTNVNPVEAILGDEGLVARYGGELARDWYDVFVVNRVGTDTDVRIRERKNLLWASYDIDETNVITRIMPTGTDADGEMLYLPEIYVDSENIDSYPHPKWYHLEVSEAKEIAKGDDRKTKAQCYTEMRSAAQAEFDRGCDLPDVTLKVDFLNAADVEEFSQYRCLSNIFLGDTVRVIAKRIGMEVSMRMTQYTYDCLTKKYTSMVLGTAENMPEGSVISAAQIPAGMITGTKLAINSVGSGQIRALAVDSAQINMAAIRTAHIEDAAITRAKIGNAAIGTAQIEDAAITRAKIANAAIGTANIEDAAITKAKIGNAAIGTANIEDAAIGTAKIMDAAVTNAKIGSAAVTTANISDAAITSAKIANGAITTALIDTGAVNTAQLADASITDAKIVGMTANKITAGTIDASVITVNNLSADNITTGTINGQRIPVLGTEKLADGAVTGAKVADNAITTDKLVANAVTAAKIASKTITANQIAANTITAAEIAASTITANEIAASTITANKLASNVGQSLDLSSNTSIRMVAGSRFSISDSAVNIATPKFEVDIQSSGEDFHLDEGGGSFDHLTVNDALTAPNVAYRYTGSSTLTVNASGGPYYNLQSAFDRLNCRNVDTAVTISITSDINIGNAVLRGVNARGVSLTICMNGHTISGTMEIRDCSGEITFSGTGTIVNNTTAAHTITVAGRGTYLYVPALKIVGKGTVSGSSGIYLQRGGSAYLNGTELINAEALIRVHPLSVFTGNNVKGGNCTYSVYCYAGMVMMRGTRPDGTITASARWTGCLCAPEDLSVLTIATGSAAPVIVPTVTTSFACSASATYTSAWQAGSGLSQGYDGTRHYGCMWFGGLPSTVGQKTVRSASVTLRRISGSGPSGKVSLHLYGITVSSASGNPVTNRVDFGTIGSIGNGETATFSIPASYIQQYAQGTVSGLMLDPGDAAVISGKLYSANWADFNGYGSSNTPSISVTYDSQ